MKCVKIIDKRKLEIAEMEDARSRDGSVVIEVKKCGICGSDIHNWEMGAPVGLVLGHEYVGTVIDPGDRNDLMIGDRVTALPISPCMKCPACLSGNVQYCPSTWTNATGLALTNPGALAEKMDIRSDMVIKVSDELTDVEVAMTEPVAVGLHAIHLANIRVGEKVLVIGGGVIGLVCSMFAKMEGAEYVAVSETNSKRGEKSISLGVADEWFDAKNPEIIKELSSKGFDVVIDCSGNSAAVSTALATVRPGGTIILVGVAIENITIPSVLAVTKELTIKGAIAYTREEFETCLSLMEKKQIYVSRFVDDIVGFDQVQESYEKLTSGEDDSVKILVDPSL